MSQVIRVKKGNPMFSNAVMPLLIANIGFFILQFVPGFTSLFILDSGSVFLKPWTIVTAMFLHGDPFHLFINMYVLFMFGSLIEQRIGTKRFIWIYFVSGILASIGFVIFQELILGNSARALGASGAIMAILGLTVILLPDLKVLFFFVIPMSMRYAGIVFIILEVLGLFGIGLPGIANSAHLIGLICGLAFGWYLLNQRKNFNSKFSSGPRLKKGKPKVGYSHTIELSSEDADDYLKYGRL